MNCLKNRVRDSMSILKVEVHVFNQQNEKLKNPNKEIISMRHMAQMHKLAPGAGGLRAGAARGAGRDDLPVHSQSELNKMLIIISSQKTYYNAPISLYNQKSYRYMSHDRAITREGVNQRHKSDIRDQSCKKN